MMANDTVTDLGKRIKEIVKALRINQKEFAATINVSACYLSEIVNGKSKNPGYAFFYSISKEHGVSLDYLFHGVGNMFLSNNISNHMSLGHDAGHKADLIEDLETLDDLLWLLEHSVFFRNNLLGMAAKFFYENEEIILRKLKKDKPSESGGK